MRQRFTQIRRDVLSTEKEINQLKIDVREMREKMYQHLSHTEEGYFDIKRIVAVLPILSLLRSI